MNMLLDPVGIDIEIYHGTDHEKAAKIARDFRRVIQENDLPFKIEVRTPHKI